jgi:hypothetical protein
LIPLHAELRDALSGWHSMTRGTGPVVLSERGRAMIPLSIVVWFARAYRAIGVDRFVTPPRGLPSLFLLPRCSASLQPHQSFKLTSN